MATSANRALSEPLHRWDRAVLSGALGLLMFAVLAFGSTEPWSQFVLRGGALLLLLVWAVGRARASEARFFLLALPAAFLPLALFMVLVAAQWAGLSAYRYATMVEGMNYIAYGTLMFLAAQCMHG